MFKNDRFNLKALVVLLSFTSGAFSSCGGYDAADAEDLKAKKGQVVGVLVDEKGKAHPDATVLLLKSDGVEVLSSNNMDSDGSFSLWPTGAGTYNIIGVLGDLDKVIKQNIVINENQDGVNIGELTGSKVAVFAAQVKVPDGFAADGVLVEVLGTDAKVLSKEQGVVAMIGVPAGTYDVRFSKSGLASSVMSGVVLDSADAEDLGEVALIAP